MRFIICLVFLFVGRVSFAQQEVADALAKDGKSLNKRFTTIVSNSQNFTDYKVVKESYLLDFWKIVKDSMRLAHNNLQEANDSISSLKTRIETQKENLKRAEDEKTEMEHDSTHINAYGIDMHKGFFLTLFLTVTGGLIFLVISLYGKLSLLQRSYSETSATLADVTEEFKEHKRKSLDRQMKLSRELQDERNKLEELVHRN